MEPLTVFRNFEPLHQAFAGDNGQPALPVDARADGSAGGCGAKTEPSLKGRALVCPFLRTDGYPKISPAVIVAITNGDKLLMSRYARGAYRKLCADCRLWKSERPLRTACAQEVMEEVGLRVKNIRYYKASPGHFPIRRWWDLRQSWTGMTPYVWRKRSCARPAGLHGMKSWNTDLISAWDMR